MPRLCKCINYYIRLRSEDARRRLLLPGFLLVPESMSPLFLSLILDVISILSM